MSTLIKTDKALVLQRQSPQSVASLKYVAQVDNANQIYSNVLDQQQAVIQNRLLKDTQGTTITSDQFNAILDTRLNGSIVYLTSLREQFSTYRNQSVQGKL